MIVVFDSDVLIPMSIKASRSARLFSRLHDAGHTLVVTQPILEEVAEKMRTKQSLRRWLKLSDEDVEGFLDDLLSICRVVSATEVARGAVPDDPDDDKIVDAAVAGNADYIVSEDKHLLVLGQYEGIRIMNRVDFAAELDRLGVPDGDGNENSAAAEPNGP